MSRKEILAFFGPLLFSAILFGLHHTSIEKVTLDNQSGNPAITVTVTLSLPTRRK